VPLSVFGTIHVFEIQGRSASHGVTRGGSVLSTLGIVAPSRPTSKQEKATRQMARRL